MKSISKLLVILFIALFCVTFTPNGQAAFTPPKIETKAETLPLLPRQEVQLKKQNKKTKKQKEEPSSPKQTQGKSFLVAFLLFWFLGLLGIHRFYLGYNGMGILYLFTAALFGIGWFIDLILFIVGGLPPKGKDSYKEE
jgi:TM2 domain-containing membrane protein YozV